MTDAAVTPTMPVGRFVLKAFNTFVGMALFVACLTALFLSMRTVMDVGGSCADGGPYVSAQPCPDGVWLTPVSIFAGLFALAWLVFWNMGMPGPKWVALAWPALFLSLGWNFWEYGLDSPAPGGGTEVGWIVCGVLFVLMGGLPLFALASKAARKATFWSDASFRANAKPSVRPTPKTVKKAVAEITARARPVVVAPSDVDVGDGDAPPSRIVAELERLTALHRSGALTDAEFTAAKQQLLGGS
jgi:hypothetical protein